MDIEKEFKVFPKIPRYEGTMTITEKIDGTNAQVAIFENGQVMAGSRNRWLSVTDDNFGFAKWVKAHEDTLRIGLGIGIHYGEWWGQGIQRGYGLKEKRFSLFNTKRWQGNPNLPACCQVVPLLYQGKISEWAIYTALTMLRGKSIAVQGYDDPEGIVMRHDKTGYVWKVFFE
jgi:hypothetical protein